MNNQKKQQKAYENALINWLETFKGESVPEEKRITDFQIDGMSYGGLDENHDRVTFHFSVTPYSLEKTTWKVERSRNICFAEFEIVDGEYQLKSISETPKNYDKFLERFAEYQEQQKEVETTEIKEVQAIEENSLAVEEITKMSHTIFIICLIVFISLMGVVVIRKIKRRNR